MGVVPAVAMAVDGAVIALESQIVAARRLAIALFRGWNANSTTKRDCAATEEFVRVRKGAVTVVQAAEPLTVSRRGAIAFAEVFLAVEEGPAIVVIVAWASPRSGRTRLHVRNGREVRLDVGLGGVPGRDLVGVLSGIALAEVSPTVLKAEFT